MTCFTGTFYVLCDRIRLRWRMRARTAQMTSALHCGGGGEEQDTYTHSRLHASIPEERAGRLLKTILKSSQLMESCLSKNYSFCAIQTVGEFLGKYSRGGVQLSVLQTVALPISPEVDVSKPTRTHVFC